MYIALGELACLRSALVIAPPLVAAVRGNKPVSLYVASNFYVASVKRLEGTVEGMSKKKRIVL
jgi:hypothetical protein